MDSIKSILPVITSILGIIAASLTIIGFFYKIRSLLQQNYSSTKKCKKRTTILSKVARSGDKGVSVIGNNNTISRERK